MGEQIDVSELRNILSDCEAKVDNAVAEINRLKCIIDHIRGVLAGDADGTIFVIRTSRDSEVEGRDNELNEPQQQELPDQSDQHEEQHEDRPEEQPQTQPEEQSQLEVDSVHEGSERASENDDNIELAESEAIGNTSSSRVSLSRSAPNHHSQNHHPSTTTNQSEVREEQYNGPTNEINTTVCLHDVHILQGICQKCQKVVRIRCPNCKKKSFLRGFCSHCTRPITLLETEASFADCLSSTRRL